MHMAIACIQADQILTKVILVLRAKFHTLDDAGRKTGAYLCCPNHGRPVLRPTFDQFRFGTASIVERPSEKRPIRSHDRVAGNEPSEAGAQSDEHGSKLM